MCNNDIICLNECWVKCPQEFSIHGYEKKYLVREKCNGGDVVVFYKIWLKKFIEFIECCVDCMIWFKIDKDIMFDNKNLYICAINMPPDKNVYYRKYEHDVFDVLQEKIEMFSELGNIAVLGDLNGRVGTEPDFLVYDNPDR